MEQNKQLTKDTTYQNPDLAIAERVENLLSQMTLAEKIGQMTQVEKNSITPAEVSEYFIGSVLSGGGGNPTPNTTQTWADMVRSFQDTAVQTRLAIPLIYGSDAVHGHNNVVGAVIFPHNIGLGATHDTDLIERIGRVVAIESMATGVRWAFAPAVSVPQDIRWGRNYEGFSQDPALVGKLGAALIRGLQNANGDKIRGALASVKHFAADGGTNWGSKTDYPWLNIWRKTSDDSWSIDQGDADMDEATLRAVHLAPYRDAIAAGAQNIMVSYSSWHGLKMHAHRYLLTDVLKGEFGFKGFIVSDWMAVDQISSDYHIALVASINAGLDMVMVPFDFKRCIRELESAVNKGEITQERIDDAVRRILTVKFSMGLFEQPFTSETPDEMGTPAHREVAREAARKSLVLLKNEGNILPLPKTVDRLIVAGRGADDIGLQCGGWTIEWAGKAGDITPGTTLLQSIRQAVSADTAVFYNAGAEFDASIKADVGILVLAEEPYSEGFGDRANIVLSTEDLALIEKMKPHCSKIVTILLSGRPLIVTDSLPEWSAFIAAWLPGTEGQGVADVLFGDYPFSGRLAFNWPRSMDQVPLGKDGAQSPMWSLGAGL